MIIDVNCFYGHWPFRRIKTQSMDSILKSGKINNISSMIISSSNAIFYQDSFEGDEELFEVMPKGSFQALTVNPTNPCFEDDITEGIEKMNIKAVRIHPGYHSYNPTDKCVSRLFDVLAEHNIPLIFTYLIEDRRSTHMCMPSPIEDCDIASMIQNNKKIPVVITNCSHFVMTGCIGSVMREYGNLNIDTSGIRFGSINVIEEVLKFIPADNLLYGSNYPLYCRQSTLNYFIMDEIEKSVSEKILSGNAKRIFNI